MAYMSELFLYVYTRMCFVTSNSDTIECKTEIDVIDGKHFYYNKVRNVL